MDIFRTLKLLLKKRKTKRLGLDFKQTVIQIMSMYETKKIKSNDIPTDKEIDLYYKMYLMKFKLDRENIWHVEKPMEFKKFNRLSKTIPEGFTGGYKFMILETIDLFVGFPPNAICIRCINYEKLVKENKNV